MGKWTCRPTTASDCDSGTMDGLRGKRAPGIVPEGWRCRARGSGSGAGSSSETSSCCLSVRVSPLMSPSIEASSSSGGVCERGGDSDP